MNPPAAQHPSNGRHTQTTLLYKVRQLSNSSAQNFSPSPRLHHTSVFYKNKIYVWGGTIQTDIASQAHYLYVFEVDNKKWKRLWTKSTSKGLQILSGQCHAIVSNRWYHFGGCVRDSLYLSELWKLNLDSAEWAKCDQKGELPNPTEGGHLVAIEKNWLLHYQGFNSYSYQHTHSFFLYCIDAKYWYRCEGNYQYSLKFRLGTAFCLHQGQLFLFGGAYHSGQHLEYLNQLHQIRLTTPTKQCKAKADTKTLSKSSSVPPRAGHSLFYVGKDCLVVLGGYNSERNFSDLWSFSLKDELWTEVTNFRFPQMERIGYTCVMGEELYLFGGKEKATGKRKGKEQAKGDLWGVQIQWDQLSKSQEADLTDSSYVNGCSICFQKRNNFLFYSQPFSSQLIKDYKQTIEFPFAAFGLLLDNSIMIGATEIAIHIDTESNGLYSIKIEDDGKGFWDQEEVLASFGTFCSQNNMIMIGCEKKVKKNLQRDNQVKQYGVNLKLGCLRLGKRFLLVSYNADILRVMLYYEDSLYEDSDDRQYLLRYFARNERTHELLNPDMKKHQDFIEAEYRKHIRDVLTHKSSKNAVFIFDTVLDDEEDREIHCREDLANIFLGKQKDIDALAKKGYPVGDCVDISLRAYLSALYLKNENLNINIIFKDKLTNVNLQHLIEQIDRINKCGYAVELQGMVDFDFKFAEFYYLRQLKPQYHFFSNGILLYDKNRLICRYRPPLGGMIPFLLQQPPSSTLSLNTLSIFGFAELPENVPHNASKTQFSFTIMLEKMLSRLKFVEQSFKERKANFLPITYLPFPKEKKDQPNSDQVIFKARKFIFQQENKKRCPERGQEMGSRKRKKYAEMGDFVCRANKESESKGEKARKTRNQQQNISEPNPPVLIEHDDDSSILEILKQ